MLINQSDFTNADAVVDPELIITWRSYVQTPVCNVLPPGARFRLLDMTASQKQIKRPLRNDRRN